MLRSMWKRIRRLSAKPSIVPKPAGIPSPAGKPKQIHDTDSVNHSPAAAVKPEAADRPRRRRRPRKPSKPDTPHAGGTAGAATVQDPKKSAWTASDFDVPVQAGKTRFHEFDLVDPLMHAIADLDFKYCTPIQASALPVTLAGRDIAGRAQTGTGKTAAFLIAIFNRFAKHPLPDRESGGIASPRALVIAPTRELIMQIERDSEALGKYLNINTLALFGGADLERQRRKLERLNPELIVATPGRLLDFKSRRNLDLRKVEVMVIDEADRMLDMGFIPDVRRIVNSTPPRGRRQTLLFSATLSEAVMRLASHWLSDPERIDIEPEQVAVDSVRQDVYLVTSREKFALLYNILVRENAERVLTFVNRRDAAEQLTRELKRYRFDCDLISGALSQNQRTRTMTEFREGRLRILVATDVAGRGLHIEAVSHVINYNIPEDPEDYVHRIGRTGRAGASGVSITFACEEESFGIPPIEEYIGHTLSCRYPDPEWLRIPDDVTPLPRSKVSMPGDAARERRRSREDPRRSRDGGKRPSRSGDQRRSSRRSASSAKNRRSGR